MRKFFFIILALALPMYAQAESFVVKVLDNTGGQVPNAVVMLEGAEGQALTTKQVTWNDVMSQKDIRFTPQILVVPVGTEVTFPNQDRVRHHVYSFSRGNKFELKLYAKEDTRSYTFKKAGIVAVGCNIHDGMIGYIRVTDKPFAKITDVNGEVTFDMPAEGTVRLSSWHPNSKDKNDIVLNADLSEGKVSLTLNMPAGMGEHLH